MNVIELRVKSTTPRRDGVAGAVSQGNLVGNLRDMSSSSSSEEDDKFYWDGRAKDSDAYLGEDVFKVEAIRRRRIREGETEYLIKWMGWDS